MKAIVRFLLLVFTVAVIIASVQKYVRKTDSLSSSETTLGTEYALIPEVITPTEETQPAYDVTRCSYDIGTCRTLAEDAAIVLLCADDDVSSWDNDSIANIHAQAESAAQFLRDTATSYGYELELPVYVFATNEARQIRFDGTITTGGENCDALSSISRNWGFADKWDMHWSLQEHLQMDQITYIVAHNKDGHSFAQAESYLNPGEYDWNMPEYSIISAYRTPDVTTTILHEMLHTFGAQDFYAKDFGTGIIKYNEDRARMAKAMHPYEIMLCSTNNISKVQFSDFTAYTIGWLDEMPEEYNCDPWWIGSQWEDIYTPACVNPTYYNGRPLPIDKNRSSYNLGTLRTLKEDAAIVLLYMNDGESSWDASAMENAYENVEVAADFIRSYAASYGFNLTLPIFSYGSETELLVNNGIVHIDNPHEELLYAAKSMGFADEWEMHDKIRDDTGMEQIIYLTAFNKDSSCCFAVSDQLNNTYTSLEYSVFFSSVQDFDTNPGAYAHEILHLFGAQDLYVREYDGNTYNTQRSQMAEELFPTELMFYNWHPTSDLVLSDFTAFCVGWLDEMPEEYNCDAWWEGSLERHLFPYSIGEYLP